MIENESNFWIQIETQFKSWNDYFKDLKFLSQPVRDLYQASLKFEEIDFDLNYWISNGLFLAPKALNSEHKMYFAEACTELEIKVPYEFQKHMEVPQDYKSSKSIIEAAIKDKIIKQPFILAWGKYQQSVGFLSAICADKKKNSVKAKQHITSIKKHNIIQQHIYAYWMYKRWYFEPNTKGLRIRLHDNLAASIWDFLQENQSYKYKEELENMIDVTIHFDCENEYDLLGGILSMSRQRMKEIVTHQAIPVTLLPNLDY